MTSRPRLLAAIALVVIGLAACSEGESRAAPRWEVTAQYPHDSDAYTQGLLWADGVLYESTGRYGHSTVRRVELATGKVLAQRVIPTTKFGEGLALLGGTLYQLTWREHVAYTYDAKTLAPRDSFKYAGEGWGLATDGTSLFMSDGSDSIRVLSPSTFQTQRVMAVRHNGSPLRKINEMEYIGGELFANVYESNWIARIDPATGTVRELIDFADLYPKRPGSVDVMNGISLAPDGKQLLLTGKLWPVMFQVRLR